MTDAERERFDALVEDALEALPAAVRERLDEVPVVVLDRPTREMLADVGIDPREPGAGEDLCGLHTGVSITERSVEHSGEAPEVIHLFRVGILNLAGGWGAEGEPNDDEIYEEIRITLLHELGHHFGLDEDDLEGLGYD